MSNLFDEIARAIKCIQTQEAFFHHVVLTTKPLPSVEKREAMLGALETVQSLIKALEENPYELIGDKTAVEQASEWLISMASFYEGFKKWSNGADYNQSEYWQDPDELRALAAKLVEKKIHGYYRTFRMKKRKPFKL